MLFKLVWTCRQLEIVVPKLTQFSGFTWRLNRRIAKGWGLWLWLRKNEWKKLWLRAGDLGENKLHNKNIGLFWFEGNSLGKYEILLNYYIFRLLCFMFNNSTISTTISPHPHGFSALWNWLKHSPRNNTNECNQFLRFRIRREMELISRLGFCLHAGYTLYGLHT